jgi:hypothetical protein
VNANEAAELLAHCSGFDNRQPSVAAAHSWAAALHDVPLDADTKNAVAAYYTTAPKDPDARLWIYPHHVRTLRAKIRNQRLANFQYEPLGDETTAAYLTRYRGQVQAIAGGHVPPPAGRLALDGGPDRNVLAELEARGWQGNRAVADETPVDAELVDTVRRSGPLGVECPTCHAALGRPCKAAGGSSKQPLGKTRPTPHNARRRAAQGRDELPAAELAAREQRIRDASARALQRPTPNQNTSDAELIDSEAS